MNFIYFLNRFEIRPMRWQLAALVCISLIAYSPLLAFATVTQTTEYPRQILYQSRQNLQDQTGNSWQAIAFKRVHPEGSYTISLRLVGFPGAVALDHAQPLKLTTSLGKTLTAEDISSDISQDISAPANVAEYDMKSVLPQLQAEIPLKLDLPTVGGEAVSLSVPFSLVEEWQTIATHK